MLNLRMEVQQMFKENPDLVGKSVQAIAEFFLLQGELKYSLLREAADNKFNYYRNRFHESDPELVEKLDEQWDKAAGVKELQKA